MFQGKLAAEVKPAGEPPFFVTFQIGAFRSDAVQKAGSATITAVPVQIDRAAIRQNAHSEA